MIVPSGIRATGDATKSVEIQLTLKTCELVAAFLKVPWENFVRELVGLMNEKASPVRLPSKNVAESICLNSGNESM